MCCLVLTQTLAGTSADVIVEQRSLRLEAPQAPYSDAKSFESETFEEPTGTLVMPQAMALALILNPELAAFSHEIRAREAATLPTGEPDSQSRLQRQCLELRQP
ncbi:MAG: hypothetical protein ACU83N_10570 [Gammaproteobacteria bacterium]